MRICISLMLLAVAGAFATVDIAGYWDGVFIAWDSAPGITSLNQVGGTNPAVEFGQPLPSLGFAFINSAPVLVLATSSYESGVSDSLFLISPVDFQTVASRAIAADDFTLLFDPEISETSIQVSRHQNEMNAFFLSSDPSVPVSGESEIKMISARMSCDSPAGIYAVDTLGVDFTSWFSGIGVYTRPVCCNIGPPIQLWTFSGSSGGFSSMAHYAGVHQLDGAPVPEDFDPMLHEYFYSPGMGSYTFGGIRALGSCSDEAVGFWTTENEEELWYSVFDEGSCTASISAPAPYSMPVTGAIAMTCHPLDAGLLLVWQHDDQIRCAHWDGEWNQYYHVVETGVPALWNGNLAVYSDYDGYWIAWSSTYEKECNGSNPLASTDVPEVRYISRSSVTSIEDSSYSQLEEIFSITPNPVFQGNSLSVTADISGDTGRIELFDLTGRILSSSSVSSTGNTTIGTANLRPGTYFVRISAENMEHLKKVVVLR